MDEKNTLYHHGVPGMKWGVRRYQNKLSKARRKARADNPNDEEHEDYKKTVRSKSLKSMSTKEIQEENNRLQAERTYYELTARKQSAFEKATKEILGSIAKESAKTFISHYTKYGIEKLYKTIDMKLFHKVLKTDSSKKKKKRDTDDDE